MSVQQKGQRELGLRRRVTGFGIWEVPGVSK